MPETGTDRQKRNLGNEWIDEKNVELIAFPALID